MIAETDFVTDQALTYVESTEQYYFDVKLSGKGLRLELTDLEDGIIYEKTFANNT